MKFLHVIFFLALLLSVAHLGTPARADSGTVVHPDKNGNAMLTLSDASTATAGWGTPNQDLSIEGNALQIGSASFPHGIGTHATGEVDFQLDGTFKWLSFFTGADFENVAVSPMTVQVWLDGKQAYETPILTTKGQPIYVCVPVNGAKALKIAYVASTSSNGGDHVDLANIMLTTDATQPKEVLPKPVPPITITPMSDTASIMPKHGTVSVEPAKKWDDGLAAGNGIHGAMLYGDPYADTLLVNHCKLWLPLGSRESAPDLSGDLAEMRRIIGEKGYNAGEDFFYQKAKDAGWAGHLVWTDKSHPGFFVSMQQPKAGPVTNYARVENFATGEVWAQWSTPDGNYTRRMFVSKADNAIVVTTTGPVGKVSMNVAMQHIDNDLIHSAITHAMGMITCHCEYVNGKGGYDGAVRVINDGGEQTSDGKSVDVENANSVTLLVRILPYKIPYAGESWAYSSKNPLFHQRQHVTQNSVQLAGMSYDPAWMTALTMNLKSLPTNYQTLFERHRAIWSKIFNRVTIDLNGDPGERAMPSETLLAQGQQTKTMTPAMVERMYDAGRYVYLCSAGPDTPPNLFGIWNGTWSPAWSGDYTTDTNLQLDTENAYSANMAELMGGYFKFFDGLIPDFETNAHNYFGCRGIFVGCRVSNIGLNLHYGDGWPGNIWMPGAGWIGHWYQDYYEYTGDKEFLRNETIPWLRGCALFYEDFLKGTEDANGKYTFRPSFSAENGTGDNSSQDIEICHQVLTTLIDDCNVLGVHQDEVPTWTAMLAKLPPLLINEQGQLKEWSNPTQGEHNNHRHLQHLVGAFDGREFSEEKDAKLFAAARVALENRVEASTEDATHGFMHTGLAAASLGMGNLAYQRVQLLIQHRSIFPSMVDGHFGGPSTLCDDGNGGTTEIIDRMVVQSEPGRLALLPALPDALPKGSLSGTMARGAIRVNSVAWDIVAGTLDAKLTSDRAQSVTLVLPPGAAVDRLTVSDVAVKPIVVGVNKLGCIVALPAGKAVAVSAKLHFATGDRDTL